MDLVSNKTIDITTLALDGLMQKQRVISANIANAEVKGYQRQDVSFEGKLRSILNTEDEQERLKIANSTLTSGSAAAFMGDRKFLPQAASMKAMEAREAYASYKPLTMGDDSPAISADGNNVNIEKEMVEMAKNTSRFMVLSELQSRKLRGISEVIKGAM